MRDDEMLAVDATKLGRILSVSVRHIRRLNASGMIPTPIRIGRCCRWSVEEIRAWLRAFNIDDTLVEGVVPEVSEKKESVKESAHREMDPPPESKDDAILREAQEEWPGRVHPDDLDMHRWLDEPDNPDSSPDT